MSFGVWCKGVISRHPHQTAWLADSRSCRRICRRCIGQALTKQPVCAICVDRTRGKTRRVGFGYGVEVWLCEGHASVAFLTQRGGRDLVLTLTAVWRANGCLTAARHRAMSAHLGSLKARPARGRPGSYAWPKMRLRAERAFATVHPSAPSVRTSWKPPTPTPSRPAAAPSSAGTTNAAGRCHPRLGRWHSDRRRLLPYGVAAADERVCESTKQIGFSKGSRA